MEKNVQKSSKKIQMWKLLHMEGKIHRGWLQIKQAYVICCFSLYYFNMIMRQHILKEKRDMKRQMRQFNKLSTCGQTH